MPKQLHVTAIVENIPLCVDPRLRKQVDDLLGAGARLSVISMRDDGNAPYRDQPGLALYEYPPPKQPTGAIGYVGEYLWSFVWAAWFLLRLRLRGRIDVLQLCQPPDIYFPLAWLLRWSGTKIVVDQRDLMPEILSHRYEKPPTVMMKALYWLERRTQRAAHHSITVNSYLKDRLVGAGAKPDDVSVVYNGPVLARTTLAVAEPSLRGDHQYLVCWAGKMGRQDRVELVIRVAEHVIRKLGREDCGFVLLGDGECLDELQELTRDLELERWITFPGWISEAELFSHLATADVGIDTSLQVEVSPVKVMEYMAQGLPVICFDLQESRLLADGAGVFTPAGDVEEIAARLVELLDDPVTRTAYGIEGRRLITEQLAWERQSPIYLDAIGISATTGAAAAQPRTHG